VLANIRGIEMSHVMVEGGASRCEAL